MLHCWFVDKLTLISDDESITNDDDDIVEDDDEYPHNANKDGDSTYGINIFTHSFSYSILLLLFDSECSTWFLGTIVELNIEGVDSFILLYGIVSIL